MSKMEIEKKKCITPEGRVSYPYVFKAKSNEDKEPKYSMTLLFDKKTDLKELKRAAFNAAVETYGSDKSKWPKKLKMPFRDGDEDKPDQPEYKNTIFVYASSKHRPGIVDSGRSPIVEEDRTFYAGCYARASLIAFTYDQLGNIGVSFALQNIQKLRDGKPLSGRKNAEDEFDAVEDSSESEDSYGDESGDDLTF